MSEETTAATSVQQSVQETAQTTATVGKVDDLPQWAREAISKANDEAARYRVEKNDAKAAAKEEVKSEYERQIADLQSKFDESQTTISARELDIIKLKASLLQLLPEDQAQRIDAFSGVLQGSSEDEITSHAEQLKALFATGDGASTTTTVRATDSTQGHGNTIPLNGDPILAALTKAVGAPRRH